MNDNLQDIIIDSGEIIIDSLIDNEILKAIPVLGTSLNIVKGIKDIRDWTYLRKVKAFVENLGDITEEQRSKLIEKSRIDQKSRLKFGEALFTTIEQSNTTVKMEYLAVAFEAFLNDDIEDYDLRAICYAIDNTYIDDLILIIDNVEYDEDVYKRCISSGLFTESIIMQHGGLGVSVGGSNLNGTDLLDKFRLAWKKYK